MRTNTTERVGALSAQDCDELPTRSRTKASGKPFKMKQTGPTTVNVDEPIWFVPVEDRCSEIDPLAVIP
jgi:hypothetical protein